MNSSGNLVLTVRKNAVDTSLILTIPASSSIAVYSTTGTISYSAGDTFSIKVQNNNTSITSIGGISWLFEAT